MTSRTKPSTRGAIVAVLVAAGVMLGASLGHAAVEGTAALNSQRFDLNDVPTLTITDADLNTNTGTTQSVIVNLSSTSDTDGIGVTLTESGANTGVFNVPDNAVDFSSIATVDLTNTLLVASGDTVTLAYTDASPAGTRTATATMYVNSATVTLDADGYALDDTATVTVNDTDRNASATAAESVSVTLSSSEDTTGVTVTATETGVNTGVFTGTSTFEDNGNGSTGTTLEVNAGNTITATYAEPEFTGTGSTGRTDTAVMHQNGTAALSAVRYTFASTPTLTVTDADLNTSSGSTQTVAVNLSSTTDATGITVVLTESGANTGVFNVSDTPVDLTESGSSDDATNTLRASQGDTIALTYTETTTYAGPNASRSATATMFGDGATAAMNSLRYDFNDTATLTVDDVDANTSTSTQQTVTVNLKSATDATGITVILTETGANTGSFTGSATFVSAGSSNDASDILRATAGDLITLTYNEANASGSGTTARTATANMFTDGNATPSLDRLRYTTDLTVAPSVSDPDANSSSSTAQSLNATLTSTTDGTGITVVLTESGANTAVFSVPDNAIEFVTTGSSNDATNTLRVTQGDTLTLRYNEPNASGSGTTARTTTATVFIDSATAALDDTSYNVTETATLTVADVDRNTDTATQQTVTGILVSTTDATGISVTLTETGANTGSFTGTATFTGSGSSNDGTDVLRVSSGDVVTLSYAEPNASGAGTTSRTDTAAMNTNGTASLNKLRYTSTETATLTVVDPDLNTDPGSLESVSVNFKSTSDATGISVTLSEDGLNNSTFNGTATFLTGGPSNDVLNQLAIAQGDTVTLTYAETSTFSGSSADRTATATMYNNTATAALDASNYAVNDSMTLTVTDIDRNTSTASMQTLTAALTSDEDLTGITVTLTETSANASTFTGTATFENDGGSSTGSALEVNPGSDITLTYAEPQLNGITNTNRTDTATLFTNGSASLNAVRYDFNDTAALTVDDADLNTNAGTPQTVDVTLASEADATGILVTLTETGNDTGSFSGSATFLSAGASNGAADQLRADQGDTITLTYEETTTFDGPDADRTDIAEMFADTAAASLNQARYDFNDTATLTVTDADRNVDAGTAESFSVTLTSTTDATGISVTLTETGSNTGVFTDTATFVSTGSSDDGNDVLRASQGDGITLTYLEANASGTGTTTRTGTATMFQDANAVLSFDQRRYPTNDVPVLSVAHPDANANPSSAETLQVTLTSTTDGTGITVQLTESAANSGVFNVADNAIEFATAGSSNDVNNTLRVGTGDTLTMSYLEPNASGTGTTLRTTTAGIFADTATASLDATRYDFGDTASLTVSDGDRNQDASSAETLSVTLRSTQDATGIAVTLTETGVSTGTFTGTATFTASGSSNDGADLLRADQGDTITLSYAEPNASGVGTTARTDTAAMFADTATAAFTARRYDLNDTATVRVTDADRNADPSSAETLSAAVSSTTDGTGFAVTLTETGNDTGVFQNTITFSTSSSNAGSRILHIAAGDTVSVSYQEPDADGSGTTARSGTATTFSDTATATLDAASYALDDSASVTVSDADRNMDASAAETVSVAVTSTSDGTGITVTATETGANTGSFTGTFTFTTASSSGSVLDVAEGDIVTATYAEPLFSGTGTTNRTDTATLYVNGTATLDDTTYGVSETATMTVVDADLNTAPGSAQSVNVNFKSTTDATGITVALVETGNNTGVFTGSATFVATGASDDPNNILRISSGDTVTLTYAETTTFEGPAADRTDTAVFPANGTSSLNAERYDVADTATLTVADADLNTAAGSTQTVNVNLKSSTDGSGITVTLTETGNDTGVFAGTATFTTGASNGGTDVLQVAQGDTVTLTYADATTFDGPAADRTDTATITTDGSAALDATGYATSDDPVLTVTDPDLNTASGSTQTVNVNLASTSDATGITVVLTETGNNTGIFSGVAGFTTGASNDGSDLLSVAQGDTVTLSYAETTTFSGSNTDRTDTAEMFSNGTASLDAARYALDDSATLTVVDADLNSAAGSTQTVNVNLKSTTDATGITVTLTETGNDTGVFAGTATFTTGASNGGSDVLGVAQGDTVTMTYGETTTFDGPNADRTDSASIYADTATATLDATRYAFDDAPALTVDDDDANLDPDAAETVTVSLTSTTDATGITVTLTETGSNTGLFTDSAALTSSGASDDGNDVLRASQGDTITLAYLEPNASGSGTTSRTDTATVLADGATAALDGTHYDAGDEATLTVTDADANVAPGATDTVSVTLTSTTDGTGITVTLNETGSNTGIFSGPATFDQNGTSSDASDVLGIGQGDTVTLTYLEPNATGTGTTARTDTATVFTDGSAALDSESYGANETLTAAVVDVDLNIDEEAADTVEVDLVTDSNPTGIVMTLTETGVNSATFEGQATLTDSGDSDDETHTLRVVDGDELTLTYTETTTFAGNPEARVDRALVALVPSDFNGDGLSDLAIGAPGDLVNGTAAGAVNILYAGRVDSGTQVPGRDVGLSADGDERLTLAPLGVGGSPQNGSLFGGSLASGDFDADGYADLAIGAEGQNHGGNADAGQVTVFYGSASPNGFSADRSERWHQDVAGVAGTAGAGDSFGAALATGDVNGDGFDDLVVGVPGRSGSRGAVHVILGSASGLTAAGDRSWSQDSTGIADAREAGDGFGAAVATGDLNGDGYDEIAVGVPFEDKAGVDAGVVHVLPGSSGGPTATGSTLWHQNAAGVRDANEAGDGFGWALSTGDYDASGHDDLAIGVPFEDASGADAGIVQVLYGSSTGATAAGDDRWSQDDIDANATEASDVFGGSLATGDFDGTGVDDLAVGGPGEDNVGSNDEGMVGVFYGTDGSGLTSTFAQYLGQDKPGVLETAEAGDLYGFALQAGDYDADGISDIAIGAPGERVSGGVSAGGVSVQYGISGMIGSAGDQFWTQDVAGVLGAVTAFDLFGAAI